MGGLREGGGGGRGRASLELSKCNATVQDWRPDAEGAQQRCRKSSSGLSLCINVRLGTLAGEAGVKARRGGVANKSDERERSVLILEPALPLHMNE